MFHALVKRYITRSLYGTNKPDSFAPRLAYWANWLR